MQKKKVAVFFGGRSPEHDVSIISGLQVFQAIDRDLYDPFPVYVATNGQLYVGDALKDQKNYFFTPHALTKLTAVTIDTTCSHGGVVIPTQRKLFASKKPIDFDIAFPIFHGLNSEDGSFQGLMEFANIPYAGMRAKSCAIFMDKDSTKKALACLNVDQLPHVAIERPESGLLVPKTALEESISSIGFPCCVKPANLGSSIGVGKAEDIDQARAILSTIFKHDVKAIIEPFIASRVEYNVAVRKNPNGKIETSAIERPKTTEELLDFKEKYLSGSDGKIGTKRVSSAISQGMLSLTREINPVIPIEIAEKIHTWAKAVFACFDPAGAPRIDFIGDTKSGQIWFNELNPIPGSYAYFLWEASDQHLLFTGFLSDLLREAEHTHTRRQIPNDPVPSDAQLFKRA